MEMTCNDHLPDHFRTGQKLKYVLKTLPKHFLNTDVLGVPTISPGRPFQYLTTLSVKKCFLTPDGTTPGATLNLFYTPYYWISGIKRSAPPSLLHLTFFLPARSYLNKTHFHEFCMH